MNEVIRLSIIELLYLVLIISVSTLTVYLAITLARANDILRDLKRVSKTAASLADGVETVKEKAVQTVSSVADRLLDYLKKGPKSRSVDVDENEEL